MLLVPILLICIVILLVKVYGYVNKICLINRIPGPKSLLVIGNAHNVLLPLDVLFTFLRKLKKTYGGIYQIHACNIRTVNISNPADVEIILSSSSLIQKEIPYTFLKPWLHEGLLISNGSKWQHRRKLLTRAFHFNILKKYFCAFTEQTQKFLVNAQAEVGKDNTSVVPLISETTFNVMYGMKTGFYTLQRLNVTVYRGPIVEQRIDLMLETAMGSSTYKKTTTEKDSTTGLTKYFQGIEIIGHTTVKRFTRPWLYADTLFRHSKIGIDQRNAIKDAREFTMKIIRDRKSSRLNNTSKTNIGDECNKIYDTKLTMLDLLLENEEEGTINIEGVREEVDTFMFEGHDTTAMALSFMIMRIANENAVQNMIYEEMNSIFGQSERPATIEDINRMKYLDCCIKESLRIYPSVPFIARYISKDMELSGYKIPAGTLCNVHIYDIHHNDEIFPDPDKFIPERFLPENSAMRHPYSYIPFSAGPRNCIGQKFAMMEMKVIMSSLIRRFRLEPVTKYEDITFCTDLVLRANHPILVKFYQREQEESK